MAPSCLPAGARVLKRPSRPTIGQLHAVCLAATLVCSSKRQGPAAQDGVSAWITAAPMRSALETAIAQTRPINLHQQQAPQASPRRLLRCRSPLPPDQPAPAARLATRRSPATAEAICGPCCLICSSLGLSALSHCFVHWHPANTRKLGQNVLVDLWQGEETTNPGIPGTGRALLQARWPSIESCGQPAAIYSPGSATPEQSLARFIGADGYLGGS